MSFQYQDKWLHSYETLIFIGVSVMGDMTTGQYALDGNGTGYFIQPKDKGQYQFIHIGLDLKDTFGNMYSLDGLTLVTIVPGNHCYFNEFLTAQGATDLYTPTSLYYMTDTKNLPVGDVVRVLTSKALYQAMGSTPNAPQPTRTEMVDVLPPDPPNMAKSSHNSIGFDAESDTGGILSHVSSYSWNHTCGASANYLVLGGAIMGDTSIGGNYSVTTVTYNGASMTESISAQASYSFVAWGGDYYTVTEQIFYLLAPSTSSSYTILVTLDGTASSTGASAVSYSGAKQQAPDNSVAGGGNSLNPSINITTNNSNDWVFSSLTASFSMVSCGNTQRCASWPYASDAGPVNPAGVQTMSWAGAAGAFYGWAMGAISIAPFPSNRDVNTRFKFVARNYKDVNSRFRLTVKKYDDISTRFYMALPVPTVALNGAAQQITPISFKVLAKITADGGGD